MAQAGGGQVSIVALIFGIAISIVALSVTLLLLAEVDRSLDTSNFTTEQNATRTRIQEAQTTVFGLLIVMIIVAVIVGVVRLMGVFG